MKQDHEVKRWYVLVIAGQSNAQGFGEAMPEEGDLAPSPRIRQLGRYRGMRPDGRVEDRWNRIVEASHVLDHVKDMRFCNLTGNTDPRRSGTVGPGLFVARHLLPLLPPDAGILLLPEAHGGAGMSFGDPGTYRPEHACVEGEQPGACIGRCVQNSPGLEDSNTQGAMAWADTQGRASPLYLDLRDRLRHALQLHPDNRLLGVVWMQGESDARAGDPHAAQHSANFSRMVDRLGAELADLRAHFPGGDWRRVPWINVLATHWWDEAIASHRTVIEGYRMLERQRPGQMCLLDLRRTDSGAPMETNLSHYVDPRSAAYPARPDSLVTDGRSCEPEMIHIHLSSGAYRGEAGRRIAQALRERCFGAPAS
ncbi:sialate O-acetylesterase [Massilia oculi]|uniref:Sialate O-acetylesterase n=1 Tax=Massilia hydrophila TaxID=3044279 RepID=A0ABS7Y6B2_9BURK|nr:sialate O-acetylesterase [Massilia oculi]MCA1855235.1 sialate O-acetylesterase [Massilia oculi]